MEVLEMRCIFLSLLVIGLLVLPGVANALGIDDDLLLYFPCNEGAGNTIGDSSLHGNDGEIVDAVAWVDGKYGQALEFSEAGEVRAPYIPLNDKSFTVCLWIKPKLAGGNEQCVFSQTQVNAQNTSLHYRIYNDGTVRMGFYSNDLDAAAAVAADEWAHICFWLDVDAELRRIYINGEQAAEDAGKAGIAYLGTAGDTMIGSWGATGQQFNGTIDEVQVWDRALSEAEITESMGNIATAVAVSGKLTTTWGSLKSN
jgi:hypothetical protein